MSQSQQDRSPPPHIVVTGGNGYIGKALIRTALARGWRVTSLERAPSSTDNELLSRFAWKLGDPLPQMLLRQSRPPDAIVHAAHQWNTDGGPDDCNLIGTDALLRSSTAAHVGRFVFVSSVSARSDALNIYGRLKWRIEQDVAAQRGIAARVNVVYGGPPRGQYAILLRLARMGILPMMSPHHAVQPIHLSEVCDGLLRLAMAAGLSRSVYQLAAPHPITFGRFLRTLARLVHGRRLLIIPVPSAFALLLANITRVVPFLPTIDRERILGLKGIRVVANDGSLPEFGLAVGEMEANLRAESPIRRRQLLREGEALLRYVMGTRPKQRLLRRYVSIVEVSGQQPIVISLGAERWPWLLRFAEPLHANSRLSMRLSLATRLAETSPAGFDRFFAYRGTRLGRLGRAGGGILVDVLSFPFRLRRR